MTIKQFVDSCKNRLNIYPDNEARAIAMRLLQDMFSIPNHFYITHPEQDIPMEDDELESIICRLEQGDPIQYVIGWEYFCGYKFNVGKGVLIPRPETEELVNLILNHLPQKDTISILDFATGSGAIVWSLCRKIYEQYPDKKVIAIGCDISDDALQFARNQPFPKDKFCAPHFFNFDILNPDLTSLFSAYKVAESKISASSQLCRESESRGERCESGYGDDGGQRYQRGERGGNGDSGERDKISERDDRGERGDSGYRDERCGNGDMCDRCDKGDRGESGEVKFDIIVSNPPYLLNSDREKMHKNVLDFEPHLALFADDNTPIIFYEKIAELSSKLLSDNGILFFEINDSQSANVVSMLKNSGFAKVDVVRDIFDKDRFLIALPATSP